ncbi:MAG: hypothetical protein WDM88_09175 [Galbitalea sp.]
MLTKAVASNINLRGSIVHGLYANFIRISETLNIGGGFTCHGQTKLFGAEIGELEAEGGVFSNSKGFSINADYIRVHGFATLERSRHLGTLRMLGAQIDGQLDCSSVKFQAPLEGDAITLDSASIQGGVVFDEAQIRGPVWLVGLKAEGELSFQRAIVEQPSHRAIDGSSMRVRNVNFTDATIRGEVKIVAADLLSLDCYGARFVDPRRLQPSTSTRPRSPGRFMQCSSRLRGAWTSRTRRCQSIETLSKLGHRMPASSAPAITS